MKMGMEEEVVRAPVTGDGEAHVSGGMGTGTERVMSTR
jgi:hypothetical protein